MAEYYTVREINHGILSGIVANIVGDNDNYEVIVTDENGNEIRRVTGTTKGDALSKASKQ